MRTIHDTFADAQLDATLQSRLVEDANQGEAAQRFCDCAELIVNGRRRPCPQYHDCAYVKQRNKLIPSATRLANKRLRLTPYDDSTSGNIKFTRLFSKIMDELSLPLLQKPNGATDTSTDTEQAATEDDFGERVHEPREVMTVPLMG